MVDEKAVVNQLTWTCRLTEIKEARDKLQESLSKAEKQLATSEAKSAFRQTNVEKAEERAAALDLKLKAKASFVSGCTCYSSMFVANVSILVLTNDCILPLH